MVWAHVGFLGGGTVSSTPPSCDRYHPRWPKNGPQGSQGCPEMAPRGGQEASRGPQDAPNMLPRDSQ
eukprot:7868086-Pyramimonas_sp.AAC.1